DRVIIATGGGAVCSDDIWDVLLADPSTLVIRLDAEPETLLARLRAHAESATTGETTRRPMLDAADPLARIRELLASREAFDRRAHISIPVGRRPANRTSDDVAELVQLSNGEASEIRVELPHSNSRILVGPNARNLVPSLIE